MIERNIFNKIIFFSYINVVNYMKNFGRLNQNKFYLVAHMNLQTNKSF